MKWVLVAVLIALLAWLATILWAQVAPLLT
jgi:hypothetical protein